MASARRSTDDEREKKHPRRSQSRSRPRSKSRSHSKSNSNSNSNSRSKSKPKSRWRKRKRRPRAEAAGTRPKGKPQQRFKRRAQALFSSARGEKEEPAAKTDTDQSVAQSCNNLLGRFIEMKDTSELMIDLAYSSLLYNNRVLAEEVYLLEERVDELNSKIHEDAICEVIADKNEYKALAMIQLAQSIEVIADSARAIADVVLRDIEPHPIIKMSIRESDTNIVAVKLEPQSVLVDKTLAQTQLAKEIGMWVISLRRGGRYLIGPKKDTYLRAGDYVIARGSEKSAKLLTRIADGSRHRI